MYFILFTGFNVEFDAAFKDKEDVSEEFIFFFQVYACS